ncbi:MAG: DUF1566 domain-containing protein [Candidatus Acidiferrales bacterium]
MRISRSLVVMAGVIVFSCIGASSAAATPCGAAVGGAPTPGTNGLWFVNAAEYYDFLVYDSNLGVCWLADANMAGDATVVKMLMPYLTTCNDGSAPAINPDGTMDYATALIWVCALNTYNGTGWLHHAGWQLPATPLTDNTCSSENMGMNFGLSCTLSPLSHLYYVGLKKAYPDSVAILAFTAPVVFPFLGLEPGVYWTSDSGVNLGQMTFSFNDGQPGTNTTTYNLLHVLPMTGDDLTGKKGTPSNNNYVVPYTSGPGLGTAVYDTVTGISWPVAANLAALNNFGVTATTPLTGVVNGKPYTAPSVDSYGDVYYPAVGNWIAAMNLHTYAGSAHWTLPSLADLQALYHDMGLTPGVAQMEFPSQFIFTGPFISLTPGFYWSSCSSTSVVGTVEQCNNAGFTKGANPVPTQYSFNFDDGFLGTDENTRQFYVMVYYVP